MTKLTPEEIEFLKESNAIEGVYDDTSLDQAKTAWKYLKKQKELTIGIVLKTHKILMLHQPLYHDEKGYFRRCGVMIGGRFGMNWLKVPDAVEAWVKLVNDSVALGIKTPEVDIRFHHIEYERIHPFIDGNGRTGRLFMAWERLQVGLPWLIIHEGEEQRAYYRWFQDAKLSPLTPVHR